MYPRGNRVLSVSVVFLRPFRPGASNLPPVTSFYTTVSLMRSQTQHMARLGSFLKCHNRYMSFNSFIFCFDFVFGATAPQWARASSFTRFLDHAQRRTTVGGTPLGEWSAPSQRPLPYNTQHSQQTDIPAPVGIRTHNLSRQAAADLRHRRRGHWGRL